MRMTRMLFARGITTTPKSIFGPLAKYFGPWSPNLYSCSFSFVFSNLYILLINSHILRKAQNEVFSRQLSQLAALIKIVLLFL